MVRDERDANRSFKTYTIPRKERRPSEDCQFTLPVDSREAKEIEHAVRRLTWDTNDLDRAVSISHIKKVDNPNLEREYHEKRATLREEGRSSKELTEQLAFCVETEDSRVKEICRLGLECEGENHTLGDGSMGVTVWKCPDLCLRALSWPASGTAYLLVFKIVKGRVKSVTPKLTPETPNLEPTPNYDCHMSRNPASSSVTDLFTLMRSTQYYLYEYDDEGLPSKRPRHCLPFAVIPLKRNERKASPIKPVIPLEKPASPVKESTKSTQDMKIPSFSDEDGILAWRGLVTSNEKSLGCVSLLAGHKLGFNFWKSYLDVSRKMPLKQLSMMLPGDTRSAWKSPLLYRNRVLSLCTMKATPRQPNETFTGFTRHLAIKAKSAGVVCIDSSTTMFLVPSSKLTVHLGFCADEKPLRMFCIVCRRQSIPLSPTSSWPLASSVTPSVGGRSPISSHTGSSVGTGATAIRPTSLDLKAQHNAKVVVSSMENKSRLSPKHVHPRQIVKRSLSFPFSPAKDASKHLLRISRSASTSGSDGSREDSTAKPAMPSEVSGDYGMHRSYAKSLGDDSRAIKSDSSDIRTNSNKNSLLCLNSVPSREKYQDRPSCNCLDTEQAMNTPDLNNVSSVSANTLTSFTPELVTVNSCDLAALKKCSNVSKKPHCGNSDSELKPFTPDKSLELRTNCDASSKIRESEQCFIPRSPLKRSVVARELTKTNVTIREDPITPSTFKDACQGSICTGEKLASSITDRRKHDASLSSTSLAHRVLERAYVKMKESPEAPLAVEAIPSPTNSGFSPFWPDSPIVFSSCSDRIPFISGTPVKKDRPTKSERNLSEKPIDNWCLTRSQLGDKLSVNTTRNLAKSIDEADSSLGDLMESPFLALEEKTSHNASWHLENWNKNSSFLNDKQALQSSKKVAAQQKSPELHKNTETYDDLQTIDMEISEPSNTDSSNLLNTEAVDILSTEATQPRIPELHDDLQTIDMEISEPPNTDSSNLLNTGAVDSLSKEATQPRIPQVHDDLQTVDMEISELPQCPIILSHAYSSAPSVPPYDCSSRQINAAGFIAPCASGYKLSASVEEPASDTLAGPSGTNTAKTSEPLPLVFSDVGNAWKEDADSANIKTTHQTKLSSSEHFDAHEGKSFARDEKAGEVNSTTANVDVDSKTLVSADIVEPVDMDIADDLELVSNTVALNNDGTIQPAPSELAEDGCVTKNSEEPFVPMEIINDPSENENSLAAGASPIKLSVSGICKDTAPDLEEVTESDVTTDQSETKLSCRKRPYSCLASSPEQDTDNSVAKDLEQKPVQTMLSTTSDAATEKARLPNEKSPTTCSLTNREAVGFSFSPTKSPKLCTRQLKTLQDAFTAATNCDQPNLCVADCERDAQLSSVDPCKSSPRSLPVGDLKTQTKDVEDRGALKSTDFVIRANADDSATTDESNDYKPLAVNCSVSEKDGMNFPEHTEPQLGGVIETSLFQDWGLLKLATDSSKLQVSEEDSLIIAEEDSLVIAEEDSMIITEEDSMIIAEEDSFIIAEEDSFIIAEEDSFIIAEHDGSTEVVDIGSEADQALEPIERWPMIDGCDFPEPETVICSPMNSIETFTLRFPGKFGFDEDMDEVSRRETTTTDEETILVEERFRGVCVEPEVVICSDENSQTNVTSSEDIVPRIGSPDNNTEKPNSSEDLKISGSQCEDSKTFVKVASAMPVSQISEKELHVGELSAKIGFECENGNVLEGSGSMEQHPKQTENCREGCLDTLLESLAPQSLETSKEETLLQTKQSEVSQTLETEKEDVASPIFPKPEIYFSEKLNAVPSVSVETTESVALVCPHEEAMTIVKAVEYSSEMKEIRPKNAEEKRVEVVNYPGPCSTEVNKSNKQSGNVTGREEAVNLSCPTESSEDVQEKRHAGTSTERVQEIKCSKKLLETKPDPKQENVVSSSVETLTLPKNCSADNLTMKPSGENKQFTATLNEGVKPTKLDSAPPTQNINKRHSSGVNNTTDCTAIKDVRVKSVEPKAKIVKHDKSTEETTKIVESHSATANQPHLSRKPESDTQEGKTKHGRSGTSRYRDSRGRSKPLRETNDPQRDNRAHTGKRKHVAEPENMAKQRKLSPVPLSANAVLRVERDHVARENPRELNFGDNRFCPQNMERGLSEYSQAEYQREAARLKTVHQQYSYPCWLAPTVPAHLNVRNGERDRPPHLVSNDSRWYQPSGVTNQNRFQQVYPSLPDYGRPMFVPSMCRPRPMFTPTPTMPRTWPLPGNSCQVPYPLLGPR
ncbi:uncharacterized protein LOC144666196 isoform X2 [Oculina patagonica]